MSARKKMRGFSIVELMIVCAIMMIMLGTAFIQIAPMLKESQANAAFQTTLGMMRRTQEMAVDQRQVYRLTFTTPGTIQLDLVTIDAKTNSRTFTLQSKVDLPTQTQFTVVSGLPNTPTTVPDGYGNGTVAIDFDRDNSVSTAEIYFQRDGRALNRNNLVNNGLIYMCRPGELSSCKAVSLIGTTGRVKGWRISQTGGTTKWIQ